METQVKMELYGNGLYIPVQLWSVIENKYKDISLTLDTGASVTTMTPEIFYALGYEPSAKPKMKLTTASDVTYVSHYMLDAIKLGDIELNNIEAYGLKFPEESFSMGVIGLNVLRQFDVGLIFSQKIIQLRRL